MTVKQRKSQFCIITSALGISSPLSLRSICTIDLSLRRFLTDPPFVFCVQSGDRISVVVGPIGRAGVGGEVELDVSSDDTTSTPFIRKYFQVIVVVGRDRMFYGQENECYILGRTLRKVALTHFYSSRGSAANVVTPSRSLPLNMTFTESRNHEPKNVDAMRIDKIDFDPEMSDTPRAYQRLEANAENLSLAPVLDSSKLMKAEYTSSAIMESLAGTS
ncbi:hypothetical protein SISNIDRAFT_465270 [Sistotremastrum niveocremeum HHB9708]|uniref:Uncharacterized protein n=1 Tax=Sistotremastrum niveocremeum HHB9708 TaxID=1314777 RepID=A0A164VP16_9AGAM|nr:hypothetical protein SISNIDRAFT_465270 [Sistotremastrum niveocremeum HHB9708]